MYQSAHAARHSADEHAAIVQAMAARDENLAVSLMAEHLHHVEDSLMFERTVPSNDVAQALR
jgi:DNA-binding GntR family transcriptional regulator